MVKLTDLWILKIKLAVMNTPAFLNFETSAPTKQTRSSRNRTFLGVACVALVCFAAFKLGQSSTSPQAGSVQHKAAKTDKFGKTQADYEAIDTKLKNGEIKRISSTCITLMSPFCKKFCNEEANKKDFNCRFFKSDYNAIEKACKGDTVSYNRRCRLFCVTYGKGYSIHPGCRKLDGEIWTQ